MTIRRRVLKRNAEIGMPIFSAEFEKMVHILAGFGKRNTGGLGNLVVTNTVTPV